MSKVIATSITQILSHGFLWRLWVIWGISEEMWTLPQGAPPVWRVAYCQPKADNLRCQDTTKQCKRQTKNSAKKLCSKTCFCPIVKGFTTFLACVSICRKFEKEIKISSFKWGRKLGVSTKVIRKKVQRKQTWRRPLKRRKHQKYLYNRNFLQYELWYIIYQGVLFFPSPYSTK